MSSFEQNKGILLDFIDYTSQFKDAMRNWKTNVRKFASYPQNNVDLAEIIIKRKLSIEDKVWAIGISKEFNNDYDYKLSLRIGPQERSKPFNLWSGYELAFSENSYFYLYVTSLLFRSSNKEQESFICLIRQIEGRPLKLRELYNKLIKKKA